jgi:DNA end-binding protein Ku
MPARSIASLSLSFGLVSIPVKLYSATESAAASRVTLMSPSGARVRQQYVADSLQPSVADDSAADPGEPGEPEHEPASEPTPVPPRGGRAGSQSAPEFEPQSVAEAAPERALVKGGTTASQVIDFPALRHEPAARADEPPATFRPAVLGRAEMVKGYEYEKGRFVLFTGDELKALEAGSRQTIDIVSFVPADAIDPIYFDKPYFLAPDKRGAKPYSLLLRAMRETGRCALAKWAFRSKEYLVQIRPGDGGMVLQQLLYAEEVRSLADLDIELVDVSTAELELARRLIEQIGADRFEPSQYVDEEKQRILAAVEKKIAGKQIVAPGEPQRASGAEVVDLVEALRASLQPKALPAAQAGKSAATKSAPGERKPARRAAAKTVGTAAPPKAASRKGRGSSG